MPTTAQSKSEKIEHNLDIIKVADHIIDMRPEGGDRGGEIVAVGSPTEVSLVEGSYTGGFLRPYLTKQDLTTIS